MSRSEDVFFRAGYVISVDAWERYFSDGHGRRIEADDDIDADRVQPSGEFEDGKEDSEPLAKQQSNFGYVTDFRRAFRGLYRGASPEVKARLVLPHSEY